MLDLIKTIADYGISGCVIGAQLWLIVRLDRRLEIAERRFQEECARRVADAKAYTEMALEIDGRVTRALNHLGDLLGSESNGASTYLEE